MDCELRALIETVQRWQTLIGAILGGLFALTTALIVARSARHHDEEAAGYIVVGALTPIGTVSGTLKALSQEKQVAEENLAMWYANMLALSRPVMPAMFDSSVARLVSVDVFLAAHLGLFQQAYGQMETALARLIEDMSYERNRGEVLRSQESIGIDRRMVIRHFQIASEHSECAAFLIGELVLSRLAFWHRFRRHLWFNDGERKSKKLLEEGRLPPP